MLDVLHVFFEEDMLPSWEQGAQVKSAVRKSIYMEMYGTEYKYVLETDRTNSFTTAGGPSIYDDTPDGSVKPYFPPSTEDELSSILGLPMGE